MGGHRQTLLGYWRRRLLRWTPPVEDIVVDAPDGARLLLRASWQAGIREARPALVLVHGLGGSDAATYVLAAGLHAWQRGWHVVRMNMRGAGDAEALDPRLYNAGLDSDAVAAFGAVARVVPQMAAVGFSLGANLTLLALGRNAARLPPGLVAAAGVSPPLDLAACADSLGRPQNRLYQEYFMLTLRAAYRRRQSRLPDLYERGREHGLRSVRDYDAAITAPYGGYRDADDYYARSSSGPHLAAIDHPVLILAAEDDPMVPSESVARWPLPLHGRVRRELLPTGGHMGFVAPTRAPGAFWAAERVLEFVEEAAAYTGA